MFATNLKAAREAKGLRISDLARDSGIHRVTLHHLEAGSRQPRMGTLDKLAAALRMEPKALLFGAPLRAPRRRTG